MTGSVLPLSMNSPVSQTITPEHVTIAEVLLLANLG
jgi:hypothetical protein